MWIHLPSTLLASVQDTQESNLDSEKLSQLEQSAMWKSKFLQQRSWQSVWKRDTSIKLLSGLTSKPSTLNHGVEKWISSLGDSHVNPFRLQDSNEEKMTKETYGLTQPDLFGGLGHQSSFLKMCQESSNTISVKSDPNFERWVTKLRKDYSQRSKQAHLTNDNGFSSWPTPTEFQQRRSLVDGENKSLSTGVKFGSSLTQSARENWRTPAATDPEGGVEDWSSERFKNIEAPQIKLRDQAANWTTPLADDTGTRKNKFAQGGSALSYQANNWPTPRQRDHKDGMASTTSLVNGKFVRTSNTTGTKYGAGLDGAAANWPTPRSSDDVNRYETENWRGEDLPSESHVWRETVQKEIQKWGTPAHRDYKGFDGPGKKNKGKPSETYLSIHQDPMTQKDGHTCSVSCRRLNPLFAEHLMGLPLGWTCVSEPLEMELYQQWQQELSSFLYRN